MTREEFQVKVKNSMGNYGDLLADSDMELSNLIKLYASYTGELMYFFKVSTRVANNHMANAFNDISKDNKLGISSITVKRFKDFCNTGREVYSKDRLDIFEDLQVTHDYIVSLGEKMLEVHGVINKYLLQREFAKKFTDKEITVAQMLVTEYWFQG